MRTGGREEGRKMGVREVNNREPLIFGGWLQPIRLLGCPLEAVPPSLALLTGVNPTRTTLLAYDSTKNRGWICASEDATDEDLFHSTVQLEFVAMKLKQERSNGVKQWMDEWDEEVTAFELCMAEEGWRLTAHHFGFGDWREPIPTAI
jgi:hypothetical protein